MGTPLVEHNAMVLIRAWVDEDDRSLRATVTASGDLLTGGSVSLVVASVDDACEFVRTVLAGVADRGDGAVTAR